LSTHGAHREPLQSLTQLCLTPNPRRLHSPNSTLFFLIKLGEAKLPASSYKPLSPVRLFLASATRLNILDSWLRLRPPSQVWFQVAIFRLAPESMASFSTGKACVFKMIAALQTQDVSKVRSPYKNMPPFNLNHRSYCCSYLASFSSNTFSRYSFAIAGSRGVLSLNTICNFSLPTYYHHHSSPHTQSRCALHSFP
jgi:hypothetical protein